MIFFKTIDRRENERGLSIDAKNSLQEVNDGKPAIPVHTGPHRAMVEILQ
jgi:hypothetical protein